MSWMQRCYEVYEQNLALVGNTTDFSVPLLPVGHTTQKANIELYLTASGDFSRARVLFDSEMTTIIPCTEDSSARTSGLAPHPLADKLQYIAGDYAAFGGPKTSCWQEYIKQLQLWCQSPYAHPKVCAVLAYLEKGTLIADLIQARILWADQNGLLLSKWPKDALNVPPIFQSVTGGHQSEAFVRFVVDHTSLAADPSVWNSFIQYYATRLNTQDYCYVQGKKLPVSQLSPYKIRNAGDRAKLISSNDSANFTYRGRFSAPQQAMSIGYETTQKAHSALRWLISRQGTHFGDLAILVWGTCGEPVPDIQQDTFDLAAQGDPLTAVESFYTAGDLAASPTTRQAFADRFNKVIAGYGRQLDDCSQISVLALDSATPGRMSIRYYRELSGSRLLSNITAWHKTYTWLLEYRTVFQPDASQQKPKPVRIRFVGAPAPLDIAKAAYGEHLDDKLKQQTIERLIPCIVEGKPLPRDLMLSAVHRFTGGIGLDPWERRKTFGIACALVRGFYARKETNKEVFTMYVDENCSDRSYLYGRLLAYAEQIERHAQMLSNVDSSDKRPTNAERFLPAFTQRPAQTAALLNEKLRPYLDRILSNTGKESSRYQDMLRLISRLGLDDFNDKPLTEKYLLGYAAQKTEFRLAQEEYQSRQKKED